jgi:hypothetical protein
MEGPFSFTPHYATYMADHTKPLTMYYLSNPAIRKNDQYYIFATNDLDAESIRCLITQTRPEVGAPEWFLGRCHSTITERPEVTTRVFPTTGYIHVKGYPMVLDTWLGWSLDLPFVAVRTGVEPA